MLIDPASVEALEAGLAGVLRDEATRQEMRARGLAQAAPALPGSVPPRRRWRSTSGFSADSEAKSTRQRVWQLRSPTLV